LAITAAVMTSAVISVNCPATDQRFRRPRYQSFMNTPTIVHPKFTMRSPNNRSMPSGVFALNSRLYRAPGLHGPNISIGRRCEWRLEHGAIVVGSPWKQNRYQLLAATRGTPRPSKHIRGHCGAPTPFLRGAKAYTPAGRRGGRRQRRLKSAVDFCELLPGRRGLLQRTTFPSSISTEEATMKRERMPAVFALVCRQRRSSCYCRA
jgi:hypothetical protein